MEIHNCIVLNVKVRASASHGHCIFDSTGREYHENHILVSKLSLNYLILSQRIDSNYRDPFHS